MGWKGRPEGENVTELWRRYERGAQHHARTDLYERTALAHRMFEGDQWHGLEDNSGELPVYNFLQPTVEYKASMVAMNSMAISYSPFDGADETERLVCGALNARAARQWERMKMDTLSWAVIRDACIAGDSYLFFYDGENHAQVVDNTSLYLADEQESDLQKQRYLLIYERRFVDDVKREARKNGLSEEEVARIVPDDEVEALPGGGLEPEVESGDGRCGCLLELCKKDGIVHMRRGTRGVIYQPDTKIAGLRLYPIAGFVWMRKKGSARGIGEVLPLVPNQIACNRLLARREANVRLTAFAKPVYNSTMIPDVDSLCEIGAAVEVNGLVDDVAKAVAYLSPAPMSPDARILQEELISRSRELAGAGDAATGQVDPTRASGAAIIAVQDQAAIPLNEQIAAYRQFVEDVALVWYAVWTAYHPKGLLAEDGRGVMRIPASVLESLRMEVRVDVSPQNPFSRFAQEQALEQALEKGHITFEEYVGALDDSASAPKSRFARILQRREASLMAQGAAQQQ